MRALSQQAAKDHDIMSWEQWWMSSLNIISLSMVGPDGDTILGFQQNFLDLQKCNRLKLTIGCELTAVLLMHLVYKTSIIFDVCKEMLQQVSFLISRYLLTQAVQKAVLVN